MSWPECIFWCVAMICGTPIVIILLPVVMVVLMWIILIPICIAISVVEFVQACFRKSS